MDLMKISAEEFVGRLAERPQHTQHAVLLGAGCSVTSGIPAAGALVEDTWLPRLHRYRGGDGESLEDWAARAFPGYDPNSPALSYGPVMEALFPLKHDKQKEVERICRNHDPGFGCCVLAKLIERASPDFNVVLTTNFDDLIADALYLFTESRPLVIPHAALAGFMRADFGRPLVVKLHGDHQLEPLNTKEELAALNAAVRERLQSLLQQRGLVVMGYAGNDDSVMDALERLPGDTLGPGVWWVARSTPNDRVLEWLSARKGYWVESADFDQLMLLVQQRFKLPHPEIARWQTLQTNYFEALSTLRTAVEKLPASEPSAPALKEASAQAVERIPDWWQVELRARPFKDSDPNAADAIYRAGLEGIPHSPELLGNYAVFLSEVRRDADAAEALYKRAIDADPTNPNNLGNYAIFLKNVRKQDDAAEDFYKRALDRNATHATNLGNYAIFLKEIRKDYDAAEALYKRAIDADPTNANVLGGYAIFLDNVRRDSDAAEDFYKRAIDADPTNPNNLSNYALFLKNVRRDGDAAEDFYKRAIDADPTNASALGGYAVFLNVIRGDDTAAEDFYKRAIDADPTNANALGGYALFLKNVRRDDDAAEDFYKRAIDADPTNATNLSNYAVFLNVIRGDDTAAEDFYKRAIDADPTNANALGGYALFLNLIRGDDTAAEALYKRAIDADPTNANNLGNYARHQIHDDRITEGIANAERALDLAGDTSQLLLELWFYLYANGPQERRQQALAEEKRLLSAGTRSPGWDLAGNVARAEEHHHPEAEWLPRLASVLTDEALIETLDDWEAWSAA